LEACRQAAEAQYLQCSAGCPSAPPPTTGGTPCLEQCGAQAQQAFQACRAQGGTVDSCTETAKAGYLQCASANCANQAPPTCEARCTALADECVAAGHPADACTTLVQQLLAHCVDENCAEPAPDCRDDCDEHAEQQFEACVAGGGSEEACRRAADSAEGACVMHCGDGSSE